MTSERTLELALSKDNIKSAVETSLLRSVGVIHDGEDVEFDLGLPEIVPVKLKITRQEVDVIRH